MKRRALAAVTCVWLLTAVTAQASADSSVFRRMRFAERSGQLVLTTSFGELFDASASRRLASGLPSTVSVRVYVYPRQGASQPLSLVVLEHEVVYDLWDEVYVIRSRDPRGRRQVRTRSQRKAIDIVTELDRLPVAPLGRVAIGPHHFVAIAVELNPVSPELRAEMRRWLSQPAGKSSLDSSSSFFGSFVSVFVNPKLERADRVLRLRSQPFYRVPR